MNSKTTEDLESLVTRSFLNMDVIDTNIFRSFNLWHPPHLMGVYGGQLVGQALAASSKTVPHTHKAHSLHCYYLNKGVANKPILYYVERTRDGNTYNSRNVKAVQDDQTLLTMQTSFKSDETDEFNHQFTMPRVDRDPQDLRNMNEILEIAIKNDYGTQKERELLQSLVHHEFPFEIKPINTHLIRDPAFNGRKRKYWIKAASYLGDDCKIHQCAAAFLTDFLFVDAASLCGTDRDLQVVSLDHSIWFHNTFNTNDWLLYEIENSQRGNGTALATGRLWKRDGVLAMSVAQEGIMRKNSKL